MVLFSSLLVIALTLVVALAIAAAGSSTQTGPVEQESAKRTLKEIGGSEILNSKFYAPSGATASALKGSALPSAPLIFAAGLQ